MKPLYLLALSGIMLFAACGDKTQKEEEQPAENAAPMTSEEFLNAYADSLNTVGDSIINMYKRLIDGAASNLDSAKEAGKALIPDLQALQARMNHLNEEVSTLVEKKWLSEEHYQQLFNEVDLSGIEGKENTLMELGFDFGTQENIPDSTQRES